MFKSTLPDVKGRSYTPKGVVSTIVYADNYDGKMHDMIDGGLSNLEEQAIYQGVADGIIGITITSCSTFYTDDNGHTYPDLIIYGTVILFDD